jgi:hypothetical protein
VARHLLMHEFDKGTGDDYKMNEYLKANYSDVRQKYMKLTSQEKKELIQDLTNLHKDRVRVVRANHKAVQQDVDSMFMAMEEEVSMPSCQSECTG